MIAISEPCVLGLGELGLEDVTLGLFVVVLLPPGYYTVYRIP